MTDHVIVSAWGDIDSAPDQVSGRDKQRVADLFRTTSWENVVWIPEWLQEDDEKDIETVESSDHLAVGTCDDYSDKAWRFNQPHRQEATNDPGGFLPKASVVVFERSGRLDDLETPQAGLGDFAP